MKNKKLGPPALGESKIRRLTFHEAKAIKGLLPGPRGIFIQTGHTGILSFWKTATPKDLAVRFHSVRFFDKQRYVIISPSEDTQLAEIALHEFWGEEKEDVNVPVSNTANVSAGE